MAHKWDFLDSLGMVLPAAGLANGIRHLSTNSDNIGKEVSKLWNGLTGETSAQATLEANERNIANQNYWNQIAMQREDTAHQREVADLQAAGLNPWLSVGGSGSSTATMSTAEAQPVDGSKILQATTAMALLALTKGISSLAATSAKQAPKLIYHIRKY